MQTATFAAGCFWGVEAAFLKVDGVLETRVGYTGGELDEPTYKQVCNGDTGHAEAVEIKFDESRVSFKQLLNIFFWTHDPTQLNRQGPDVGTQYRSAIFFHSDEQKEEARKVIDEISQSEEIRGEIVTELKPVSRFWPAEEYHQRYFEKQGIDNVCHN